MKEKLTEFKKLVRVDKDIWWKDLEYGVLYYFEKANELKYLCPCGCNCAPMILKLGDEVIYRPAQWTIKIENEKATILNSVLSNCCKAHYWISKNKIVWC